MSFSAITQKAMQVIAAEEAEKRAAALKLEAAAAAAAEEKERTERQARLALQAERELARMQAERLLAVEQAVAAREAESAALKAEIDRLRNRSETEILRDEIANLRGEMLGMRQMTQVKEVIQQSTVVQQEIVELKSVVDSLLKGGFRICSSEGVALTRINLPYGGYGISYSMPTDLAKFQQENPSRPLQNAIAQVNSQTWFIKVM